MIRRDNQLTGFHLMADERTVQERAPLHVRVCDAMIFGFCVAVILSVWLGWLG